MRLPRKLIQKGRTAQPESKFLNSHYLFARHKPGYDYDQTKDIPEFSKIKIDKGRSQDNQSFSWSKYAKPEWARFNDQGKYLLGHAVVAYKVSSVKQARTSPSQILPSNLGVEHKPETLHYPHSQLYCKANFKKIERRSLRLELKHGSIVVATPNNKVTFWNNLKFKLYALKSYLVR